MAAVEWALSKRAVARPNRGRGLFGGVSPGNPRQMGAWNVSDKDKASRVIAQMIRRHIAMAPTREHTIGSLAREFAVSLEDIEAALEHVAGYLTGPREPRGARRIELT